jgi:YD repeat-containing protein
MTTIDLSLVRLQPIAEMSHDWFGERAPRRRSTNQCALINRLTSRTSTNGYRATFAYGPTGRRTNMTDASGVTGYAYDSRDRLMAMTNAWANGPTRWLSYLYDANGNLTNLWSGVSTSGGVSNYFQLDGLNRLTNVLANGGGACPYGYDGGRQPADRPLQQRG